MFKFFRKILIWVFLALTLWYYMSKPADQTDVSPETSSSSQIEIAPPSKLPIPASRPLFDPEIRADAVFVDKSERRLQLRYQGALIREYEIALGFAPEGQKEKQGDGRTPTGDYLLDWRNENSQYYRSIHVSYPRPDQRHAAREAGFDPGGDIMIHGQPNLSPYEGKAKIRRDWTAGCIALSNADMDEIWRHVADGTKISIIE